MRSWLLWSAFAVIMLWVLGVSWLWALDDLPPGRGIHIIVLSLSIVCIVETIALCVVATGQKEKYPSADEQEGGANQSIAIATWMMFVATVCNIGVAALTWSVLHATDLSFDKQLKLMEIGQRPWVQPVFKGFDEMRITETTVTVGVGIELKNTGKSPAFYVLNYQELKKGNGNLIAEHDTLCHQAENGASTWKNPRVIFPDQSTDKVIDHSPVANRDDLIVSANPKYLAPEILGCIAYREGTENAFHHTWYSWSIWRSQNGTLSRIPIDPETIPGNQLEPNSLLSAGRNYAD
jgi:hypothetical protein